MKCNRCDEDIVGQYLSVGDLRFCQACFLCGVCNKTIVGPHVTVGERVFHPDCFVCSVCRADVSQAFFEQDGSFFCESDYRDRFAEKCTACGRGLGSTACTAGGKSWHPECFCCGQCGMCLDGMQMLLVNGGPCCPGCQPSPKRERRRSIDLTEPRSRRGSGVKHLGNALPVVNEQEKNLAPIDEGEATECYRCQGALRGKLVSFKTRKYHQDCFSCSECKVAFTGGDFVEHEATGALLCLPHYRAIHGKRCARCRLAIKEFVLTALDKTWHYSCFRCASCDKQYEDGSTFFTTTDQAFCSQPCFDKADSIVCSDVLIREPEDPFTAFNASLVLCIPHIKSMSADGLRRTAPAVLAAAEWIEKRMADVSTFSTLPLCQGYSSAREAVDIVLCDTNDWAPVSQKMVGLAKQVKSAKLAHDEWIRGDDAAAERQRAEEERARVEQEKLESAKKEAEEKEKARIIALEEAAEEARQAEEAKKAKEDARRAEEAAKKAEDARKKQEAADKQLAVEQLAQAEVEERLRAQRARDEAERERREAAERARLDALAAREAEDKARKEAEEATRREAFARREAAERARKEREEEERQAALAKKEEEERQRLEEAERQRMEALTKQDVEEGGASLEATSELSKSGRRRQRRKGLIAPAKMCSMQDLKDEAIKSVRREDDGDFPHFTRVEGMWPESSAGLSLDYYACEQYGVCMESSGRVRVKMTQMYTDDFIPVTLELHDCKGVRCVLPRGQDTFMIASGDYTNQREVTFEAELEMNKSYTLLPDTSAVGVPRIFMIEIFSSAETSLVTLPMMDVHEMASFLVHQLDSFQDESRFNAVNRAVERPDRVDERIDIRQELHKAGLTGVIESIAKDRDSTLFEYAEDFINGEEIDNADPENAINAAKLASLGAIRSLRVELKEQQTVIDIYVNVEESILRAKQAIVEAGGVPEGDDQQYFGLYLSQHPDPLDDDDVLAAHAPTIGVESDEVELVWRHRTTPMHLTLGDSTVQTSHLDITMTVKEATAYVCKMMSLDPSVWGLVTVDVCEDNIARDDLPCTWLKESDRLDVVESDGTTEIVFKRRPEMLHVELRVFSVKTIKLEIPFTVTVAEAVRTAVAKAKGIPKAFFKKYLAYRNVSKIAMESLRKLDNECTLVHEGFLPGDTLIVKIQIEEEVSKAATISGVWEEGPPTDGVNLVMDTSDDACVSAGSLNKLVEFLCTPKCSEAFQATFFVSLTTFSSWQILGDKFIDFYNAPPPDALLHLGYIATEGEVHKAEQMAQEAQEGVKQALRYWTRYFGTYSREVVKRVVEAIGDDSFAKEIGVELESSHTNASLVFRPANPSPPWQLQTKPMKKGAMLDIWSIPKVVFAQQITKADMEAYAAIEPRELLGEAWTKPSLAPHCTHILAFIDRFNKLSSFVAHEILSVKKVRVREKLVRRFVGIADELRKLNNFHSLMAVLGGLSNAAVNRLKWTHDKLPKKTVQLLEELDTLTSMKNGYKVYRSILSKADHAIPYIGVFLTDLIFIEDGNPDFQQGLINFGKRSMLRKTFQAILCHQGSHYPIPVNTPVQRYLIQNSSVYSEKELYALSLALEPRGAKRSQIS